MGKLLPCRVFFDKDPCVQQGAIVANKRLGAVLSQIRADRQERDRQRLASRNLSLRQKARIRAAGRERTLPPLMTPRGKPHPTSLLCVDSSAAERRRCEGATAGVGRGTHRILFIVTNPGGDRPGCPIGGRSLGSLPAAGLAATAQERLAGLIIESGAPDLARFRQRMKSDPADAEVALLIESHRARLASIRLPVLHIHGERGEVIPLQYGLTFHKALRTDQKEFRIIPGAGHSDIGWVGGDLYFRALERFISRN